MVDGHTDICQCWNKYNYENRKFFRKQMVINRIETRVLTRGCIDV